MPVVSLRTLAPSKIQDPTRPRSTHYTSHEAGSAPVRGPRGPAAVRGGGAAGRGGGDVRRDAADPVRGRHHRELAAHRGVLQQDEGAAAVHVHVRARPKPAALRQLAQRQEGHGRVQGARAVLLIPLLALPRAAGLCACCGLGGVAHFTGTLLCSRGTVVSLVSVPYVYVLSAAYAGMRIYFREVLIS